MTINHQVMREGMTVLPDAIDETTGQRIEGSAQIVDTRFANLVEEETETESYVEVDDDALAPEDRDPSMEERLAETHELIYNADIDINPEFANTIAGTDIGDSNAATIVKYAAMKTFNGDITKEEAMQLVIESGVDIDEAMQAFYQLQEIHG